MVLPGGGGAGLPSITLAIQRWFWLFWIKSVRAQSSTAFGCRCLVFTFTLPRLGKVLCLGGEAALIWVNDALNPNADRNLATTSC